MPPIVCPGFRECEQIHLTLAFTHRDGSGRLDCVSGPGDPHVASRIRNDQQLRDNDV